jgi:hypothetical protein
MLSVVIERDRFSGFIYRRVEAKQSMFPAPLLATSALHYELFHGHVGAHRPPGAHALGAYCGLACRAGEGVPSHDPRILEALHEAGLKMIRNSAPHAIQALNKMIANPVHKDHCRAVASVLDRSYPIETVYTVAVEHRHKVVVTIEEVMGWINELARRAGLDPKALPPTIDGIWEEIKDTSP